ncbi:MAG: bifunctional rhamnulose-1-phosphate aldolase/short-chain dehydrogenase [Bacteroidetes bacterium]|jgi:rhamnulose-1-phosphate aldolase/alcohol dehydrogenase|nr:bifunctional rhamnulose-1-phosphate aldolase/short-chain dehydrogenase [Bacteroidota bacterium]
MELIQTEFKHVDNLWDDAKASRLDPVERLVYRSNLLGTDWRITNTGGGNTSSKLTETDPLTGEEVEVLWVKGSGGDLRTAEKKNFASLYQNKVLALQDVYASYDERGPKTPAEDAMTAMYPHCTFNLNPRAPSIDTPLHSFVPYTHVDHTHPVGCIALATAENGKALTQEVYGDDVIWVDWQRPGFELGLEMQRVCEEHPNAKGIMMGGHGLINWADDDKECYLLSLSLIDRAEDYLQRNGKATYAFGGATYEPLPEEQRDQTLAEVLPWLRGRVSQDKKVIGTVDADALLQRFVNGEEAARLAELGTSCPDHFLRTRIKPLFVDWDPQQQDVETLKDKLEAGLAQYRKDYAAYYDAHKEPDSPAMRGSDPTVILIPGIGLIAWGKTKSESRVTAEFYKAAVEVMRGAEAVDTYTALPRQEAFDIEYWALEQAKLERMPPEEELAREIVAIVGAGSGIGEAAAHRLVEENATIAALDLDPDAAEATAEAILDTIGMGIGVAGSGLSNCGDVVGIGCDVTDRASIQAALDQVMLAYGGLDHVVITAGLYASGGSDERIADAVWDQTFAVNTKGAYLVADEAARRWEAQGLDGSLVITTSVNGVVPKAGSFAYDTSKAAANHLVRELAVGLAPAIRVNGLAPATVVEGSSMFPRERVMNSLEKYGLDYDDSESTEALRERLAQFYAERTLTNAPIRMKDQAEAIFMLVSDDRLGKTTGQILTVDGGLKEAFLR